MPTTRLSSKGQVIIPKAVREAHRWKAGQEFEVEDTDDGVLLRPADPFSETTLEDVAASLPYEGPPRSLEDMEDAIARGIRASQPEAS